MKYPRFYLQASDITKESFSRSDTINFAWNIAYLCNFRCSYCFFTGNWDEYGRRNVFLTAKQWFARWEKIHARYGRCSIIVTGGEPFVYPGFIEIIQEISAIHYPIYISTNASGDIKTFAAAIDPRKVSVGLSFHPEFNSLEKVIGKKKFLKTCGFDSEFINFVSYPPFFKDMERWIKITAAAGETLKVIPYSGLYVGKRYPDAYSPDEKKKLGINSAWENNVRRKGKFCRSGVSSALIFPDGKVARCGQIGERHVLGNFLNGDFQLLDKPAPCDVEYCPCLEGKLSEETDDRQ